MLNSTHTTGMLVLWEYFPNYNWERMHKDQRFLLSFHIAQQLFVGLGVVALTVLVSLQSSWSFDNYLVCSKQFVWSEGVNTETITTRYINYAVWNREHSTWLKSITVDSQVTKGTFYPKYNITGSER